MTLHNVPPSAGQTAAVAVIGVLILLFAVAFVIAFIVAVRRDRAERRAAA